MRYRPVFFFGLFSWLAVATVALAPRAAHAQAAATVTTVAPTHDDDGRRMGWLGLGVRLGYTQLHLTPPSSLVGAYNSDDWWYHTWYEGHRVAAAWTFLSNLYVQAAFTLQRRLDTHYWVNRYLVDIVKMF